MKCQRNFFYLTLTYKLYGCIWLSKIVTFKKILTVCSVEVSSSPNSPLLFVIVFWDETNRSSLTQSYATFHLQSVYENCITALWRLYKGIIIKPLQELCKSFIKRLHVYIFWKEHVDIFNDTLIGCFVCFSKCDWMNISLNSWHRKRERSLKMFYLIKLSYNVWGKKWIII